MRVDATTESARIKLDQGWQLWTVAALRSAGLPFGRLDALVARAEDLAPGPEREMTLRDAIRRGIEAIVSQEDFRLALTWQNPDAMANWVAGYAASILAGSPVQLDRMDRRGALIARYAQRYCAKNDTIGFFGPVAWAELGGPETVIRGSGALTRASVGLEVWALQAVARAWNSDPALTHVLPVRPDPAVSLTRDGVRRPLRHLMTLSDQARELLDRLTRAGADIPVGRLCGEQDRTTLDELRRTGVLQVGFRVPIDGHPQRHLGAQLTEIADPVVRERLTALLADIEKAQAGVQEAATADELRAAFDAVERSLTAAAGHPVRPVPGLTPGGRTPLYLDCRRDLDAAIGAPELDALAVPMSVLLDAARWLCAEVGQVAHDELARVYRALRPVRDEVTLAELQFAAAHVFSPSCELYAPVTVDFRLRWAEVLPQGTEDASMPADRARQIADIVFQAQGRLWAAARTHSPDVMLRRTADGDLRWVLGELHVALNTLESRVFAAQADDMDALVAAVAADSAVGRVVPVYPASAPEVSSRTYPPLALDPPGAYRYWSYGSDDGHPCGVVSTPATDLVVTEHAGELLATTRRDGWQAPVLECFGEFLTAVVVNMYRIREPRRCAPRIDIGDLTVCRRQWRFRAEEFGTLPTSSREIGQETLRRWAEAQGLPRHVFVKTAAGAKPFYVDFAAPVLVDNLARSIRRLTAEAPVDMVEMLPAPDELWLSDPSGTRYTSELRLVAVDPQPHPSASWKVGEAPDAGLC
ncbi:lantibiotic dehydratase [Catellatospora chokoriensis]|uniref:Lantibiotic dehydratase n=1 Tax=Catellatospora chokoriensis TaxID=310353 RepID=A0A8J3NNY9_9ACTN|nr:lantibiotic dehydratase [Catellatospora chokoriensis]GIF87672.1 lantibiotic dehydratase [Catellatospora chokoriensis]